MEIVSSAQLQPQVPIVELSSDDEMEKPHEFNDDDEEESGPFVQTETKPLKLPSRVVIKVEKDHWRVEEEKRGRRISRRAAREAKEKERSTSFIYTERVLNFSVLDCRSKPRVKASETTAAIDPFLRCVGEKLKPAITTPNLWLFIVEDDDDRVAAMKFVETKMPEFEIIHSMYIPSKAEMLNNVSTHGTAPDVPLLFLFKRGNAYADEARRRMKGIYTTPQTCVYYTDPSKNNEGKRRLRPTELRMEFYLNILQDFAAASENIFAMFMGGKFMLAAKIKFPDH